ncbi:MAG: RNA methyltransferase [Candidatus Heimdallarchaeaceae archaeon]
MFDSKLTDVNVVLVEPKIAGNIGAAARLCNNFGVAKLILVNPQIDHLSDKAIARAMHSVHYLENAELTSSLSQVKKDFDLLIGTTAKAGNSYHIYRQPIFPWELGPSIAQLEIRKAIIFGREDNGLKTNELKQCDLLLTIPLSGDHKVLNLSHAISITLYEIMRSRILSNKKEDQQASTRLEKEVLFDVFSNIITTIPYEEYRKPIVLHTFKRIINKSAPTSPEIQALIGVFKTMLKLVRKTP